MKWAWLWIASVALAAEPVDAEIIRDLDFFLNLDVFEAQEIQETLGESSVENLEDVD